MANVIEAIELMESGDWQGAHELVQRETSTEAAWAHGIVHIMEGDLRNAGYWYRRAGRPLPAAPTVSTEIELLRASLAGSGADAAPK